LTREKEEKRRKEEKISPYLLRSGFVMECCSEPWKCQGEKERCEGVKEDGQLKFGRKREDGKG
jgi:hypothetical protein